jgi:hypothetical protein
MVDLLIFLLIAISTSQLWSNSKIFGYVRRIIVKIPIIRDALLCPPCASFWVGIFVSLFFNPIAALLPLIASNAALGVINYAICGILYKNNILTSD